MLNNIQLRLIICSGVLLSQGTAGVMIEEQMTSVGPTSSSEQCCPRKQNNGVIYVHFDTLADPSEILDEYGCQSGRMIQH